MLSGRVRGAVSMGVAALALTAGPVASAVAATPTSQITAPAGTTYPLNDGEALEGGAAITVEGTTTGATTKVDIRCYGTEGVASEFEPLAEEVAVTSHKFSVAVPRSKLTFSEPGLCRLRAVPSGEEPEGPELEELFKGPIVAPAAFKLSASFGYEAASNALAGRFLFQSAEACALESTLYKPTSLLASEEQDLFVCGGTSTGVRVDEAYGYGPVAAVSVETAVKAKKALGAPKLTVSKSVDEGTGAMTINEEDPIVKCEPEALPTPTEKSCESFAPTGVTLKRTWQTSDSNHVVSMTDKWESTDGKAHTVRFRYDNEMFAGKEGAVYEFPGSSTFGATRDGQSVPLPSGAGTILYKASPNAPEIGGETFAQGAIVYDSPPSEALAVVFGSEKAESNEFQLPYRRTIPAGGSYTLRTTFVQDFALPEVARLANEAQAGYYPTVSITSPATGTSITSASPTVNVSGTASDGVALSSLSLNGQAVSVGAGGAWSTSVALSPGANTLTATATNQSGNSKSAAVTINYSVPPAAVPPAAVPPAAVPPASTPPSAHASLLGTPSGAKGKVTLTLACQGSAGTSCKVQATLSTTEKMLGGKVIGVSARTTSKRVTTGIAKVTVAAGYKSTMVIALNATGRMLLAKFGKLPVRLIASLLGSSGSATIVTQNLTVKPLPKKLSKH